MPGLRLHILLVAGALAVSATSATSALAADAPPRHACLGKAEQRAAVAAHQAVPLAQAIRAVHAHGRRGEVLRARLCRHGDRLDYVLTLLSRNGKVTRVAVDAANGELAGNR